jgi:hypothetical protein
VWRVKVEIATSIAVIPATVYVTLMYREHQQEFAYTRGVTDGVEKWVEETLARGTSSLDPNEIKTILGNLKD